MQLLEAEPDEKNNSNMKYGMNDTLFGEPHPTQSSEYCLLLSESSPTTDHLYPIIFENYEQALAFIGKIIDQFKMLMDEQVLGLSERGKYIQ